MGKPAVHGRGKVSPTKENLVEAMEKWFFSVSQRYSWPIPDPSSLDKYESLVPWAANRIIIMAEKEQDFRHEQTKVDSKREFLLDFMSIIIASFICLWTFWLAWYLFYLWEAGTAIWVIIGNFLWFWYAILKWKTSTDVIELPSPKN